MQHDLDIRATYDGFQECYLEIARQGGKSPDPQCLTPVTFRFQSGGQILCGPEYLLRMVERDTSGLRE